MIDEKKYQQLVSELKDKAVVVAVSKTKPVCDIQALYNLGHRDFGENYVQELLSKQEALPKDIRWHFIGHLQTNKVKYIVPFIYLIHGVDSLHLLKEINKQAKKNNKIIHCLLQMHIAREETKFGLDENELYEIVNTQINTLKNTCVCGLMGMASFTNDIDQVKNEFIYLKKVFDNTKLLPASSSFQPSILSMGMSNDYLIAIEKGSNMVRIGSLLFGARNTL